jgi:hypothetical protein
MTAEAAFYLPERDGRFLATKNTVGPWSTESQHLGPPSALLVRALERTPATFGGLLARITIEILGPVGLGSLDVSSEVIRPGRSVELVGAELSAGGRTLALARGWRIAHSDTAAVAVGAADPLPPVETSGKVPFEASWEGYGSSMEWRTLAGSFAGPGPATVWMRQRVPLVAGEEPSPLQRLATVADSGNGVSGWLDFNDWYFINTELTLHVHREPEGEWIGLDAATVIGPHGTGTATSTLHDRRGQVGHGAQALLVRPR